MERIWEPLRVGDLTLPNRLVMAAMTRRRATPEGVPTDLNALYYAQRASLGLIVTEGTQPSDEGQGYLLTPGIYTEAQIAGWKRVANRVRAAGGRMFIQLMHVGRISHPANAPLGRPAVAPSAVRPAGKLLTPLGMLDISEPRAMTAHDIASTIRDYRRAAASAIVAGAQGVELHGGNGYLIHQFLSTNANRRVDEYGGSVENRTRFAVEIASAVADEIGAGRVGVRISPGNPFNDIVEGDAAALYRELVARLAPLKLGYLHVRHNRDEELLQLIRADWPSVLIVNRPGRPREDIAIDLDAGLADAAAVATFALANPDLIARLRTGAPFNEPDPATFCGGAARGYTDYPTLDLAATGAP